jgi:hypothetical protein
MQDAADLAVAAQLDEDALGEAEPEEIEGLVDARGGGHNTSSTSSALVAEIQKGAFRPRVRSLPEAFRSKSGQSQDSDFQRASLSHSSQTRSNGKKGVLKFRSINQLYDTIVQEGRAEEEERARNSLDAGDGSESSGQYHVRRLVS